MNLLQLLDLPEPLCTALVGAGGKTTALFSLARQVDGPAWVTTSTHLGTDQAIHADRHFIMHDASDFKPELYNQARVTLITGPVTPDDRLHSPAPDLMEQIHSHADREGISLLIESDGSRSLPLKAPGDHEPPIPLWVTSVIVLVGFSGIGRRLTAESVFRPERFSQLTGLPLGEIITPESVCKLLLHPLGGMKNIPAGAFKMVLFNQAESALARETVAKIAPDLLRGGYDRVVAGGMKSAPNDLVCF